MLRLADEPYLVALGALRRGSRFDCLMMDATAIQAQAEVATVNESDFKVFVPHAASRVGLS